MISHEIREKLQNIVNGTRFEGPADNCATVRNLLVESFGTGSTVKSEFESRAIVKEKQASFLKAWAEKTGIWFEDLPIRSQYLTEGGESKIYLAPDGLNVIKVNYKKYCKASGMMRNISTSRRYCLTLLPCSIHPFRPL